MKLLETAIVAALLALAAGCSPVEDAAAAPNAPLAAASSVALHPAVAPDAEADGYVHEYH